MMSTTCCMLNLIQSNSNLTDGYIPAHEHDLIHKCMTKNCNDIAKCANEYQIVDEVTWGNIGCGKSGSVLTGRLLNKKVNKGGQTTIMSDSQRFIPRSHIHRHKLHAPKAGMTRRGTIEIVALLTGVYDVIFPQYPIASDVTCLFNT